MPPARSAETEHLIAPLTFLQIYRSTDRVLSALLEQDAVVQQWFGGSWAFRTLATHTGMPLYLHWATSGYGVLDGDELLGWLFLRGWHQILYVETLAVRPDARQRGIGAALMEFAEAQAHELNREWLGLSVAVLNEKAVRLYEQMGYQRGHWHILCCDGEPALPHVSLPPVQLRPLVGLAAERVFYQQTTLDLAASDPETADVRVRFLSREPYRRILGQHWAVIADGKTIAYLHQHYQADKTILYVASESVWWGSQTLTSALFSLLRNRNNPGGKIEIRFASTGHHNATCPALQSIGFTQEPAVTMKMLKKVRKDMQPV